MPDATKGDFYTGELITGRTNWKKFGLVMVPALSASAAVLVAVAQGAMATSFQVSGQPFTISFESFTGRGFQQYAAVDSGGDGKRYAVAPMGVRTMEARQMCQSVTFSLPLLDRVVLRLTAGEENRPVSARNLVVDTESLEGEAAFSNVSIGQDAGTLQEIPWGTGPHGTFGQRADQVKITHLRQRARSATAGTFTLPGLRLQVGTDVSECL